MKIYNILLLILVPFSNLYSWEIIDESEFELITPHADVFFEVCKESEYPVGKYILQRPNDNHVWIYKSEKYTHYCTHPAYTKNKKYNRVKYYLKLCSEQDINPNPPEGWIKRADLYYYNACTEEEIGSEQECKDNNGKVFFSREKCCDASTCYTPICDQNDTTFPDLTEKQSITLEWSNPEDRSDECTHPNETIQEAITDCNSSYRCVYSCDKEGTNFTAPAKNQSIAYIWSEPEDKSQACNDINGTIQEATKNCKSKYQCITTVTPPEIDCEKVGSYVTPRDGVFHEDINILGVDFNLHYSSANLDNTTIAHGWSFSNHARVINDRLYLGSGSIEVVTSKTLTDNNTSVIKSGTSELLFDADNKHIETRDAYSKLVTYRFSYDENNRLAAIDDRFGETTYINRDSSGVVTSLTSPKGQTLYLAIDESSDLVEIQYEDMSSYSFEYEEHYMTKETEPNGNAFLHFFDESGKIIKVIDAELGEWNFNSTTLDDANTHVVNRASGDSVTYKNHFLKDGFLKMEKTLANGEVVVYDNSIDDSIEKVSSCSGIDENRYKLENGVLVKDAINAKRVLESNTQTMPSGLSKTTLYSTKHTFDENQALLKSQILTTTNGATTELVKDYSLSTMSIKSPEGRETLITYNKNTQLPTKIKNADLAAVKYTYYKDGKVKSIKQGSRITKYIYDARGNISQEINKQRGTTITHQYDKKDRVVKTIFPNGDSIEYSYDKNGNMLRLTTPTPSNHNFTYNGVNKKTSMASPLGYKTLYAYDKQKRVTQITRPSGKSLVNSYEDGSLKAVTTNDGVSNYRYTCKDKISSISNGSEKVSFTYDGQLLTSLKSEGVLNQSIDYSYNNDFRVQSISYSDKTTNYSYDKDGLLTSSGDYLLTRDRVNGQVTNISDGVFNQNSSYNQFGDIKTRNSQNFKLTLKRKEARIATKKETVVDFVPRSKKTGFKKKKSTNTYNYTYDDRDRLISVSKNGTEVENYTYDANGNRVNATINGVTTTASYTLDDNLEVYGDNTYRYDLDGYLIEKVTPNETINYTYNTLGALTSVTTPSKTITYHLNANNQRVAKEVNGTIVEKYLWANLTTLLAVYDSNDTFKQRFEYSDNRMPTSMTMDNQTYYLHYDQVGSLRAVSNQEHKILKEVTYDTFGNILHDTNRSLNIPFGFAGGLHDRDTSLVHFGYREYDTYTGKWTAKDPIDFSGGDSNLYGYVLGDPVNFVDPEGLSGLDNRNGGHGHNRTSGSTYGPFGPICGSGPSAGLIPDITPKACQIHDNCYENCKKTKRQCDLELFFSNPLYGAPVILSPASQIAYDNAQRK